MARRTIIRRIGAMEVTEGAGVLVRRSIGLPGLRHLDPFLLLGGVLNMGIRPIIQIHIY